MRMYKKINTYLHKHRNIKIIIDIIRLAVKNVHEHYF